MTKTEILKGLNSFQQKPVVDYEGPCFIVAGPGAGKTSTIIARTNFMIQDGVEPNSILLFTFTNKAAKEIKKRVIDKIGPKGEAITVGTYHSVCVRILKQYAEMIGYSRSFTIFDTDDSFGTIKPLVKGMMFDHRKAIEYISDCKNKMISPAKAQQNAKTELEEQYASVYMKYQKELVHQNAMDFDDLINNTIILMERNKEVQKALNKKYHYLTADEYHDSSMRDIRLIELLGGPAKNICFILDDDQSIYSFRGADIEAVMNTSKIFPKMKTFILQQNYRSTKKILSAARSLITKNSNQLEKKLFTENPEGDPVVFYEEKDVYAEADRVVSIINVLNIKRKIPYKDIAILYRMSYLSRVVEEKLLRANIPYQIIGGLPFYSRKEIKDILCYVRFVYNPHDFEAFKRIIAIPRRGIGEVTCNGILEYSRTMYSQPIDLIQACQEVDVKGKAGIGLDNFNEIIQDLIDSSETDTAEEFVRRIIDSIQYVKIMEEDNEETSKFEERCTNLEELLRIAEGFDTLEEFVQNISLNSIDESEGENDNKVNLQTMHSAKGLEYSSVIIIGASEGICPHWKAADDKSIDEERRLFYVAMTRAEKYLLITRPRTTMQQGRPMLGVKSRFINEIDKDYIISGSRL